MDVLGYTETGMIIIILDGNKTFVPDDMANRDRYRIWDEWEMGPADEVGRRERINTIPPFAIPEPDLEEIKRLLKTQIDEEAETARLRYITGGAGQAMTYQRKVEEAKRAVLEDNPLPDDYPMLSASLGIDGETIKDIALLVLTMDAQWAVIGSAIERARQTAKEAIGGAETVEAAQIAAQVVWP
ncbi:hypothetical protein RMR21_005635 [Agrobacterium sp. rho-8.1]|nr:hypothetical protein [Agrobacterium sp. rho-8.1]